MDIKRALITGSHGTIGSELKNFLTKRGLDIICWNREKISCLDYNAIEKFIHSTRPDIIYHLGAITSLKPEEREGSWEVNYEWTSILAQITKLFGIKFIYTSTAMVFSISQQGPFTIQSLPAEEHGYGYEKRISEKRVFEQNTDAIILRLGWQISEKGKNTMLFYLNTIMDSHGEIWASTRWLPACSFLEDTIIILYELRNFHQGLYMADANEKWNFFEIVSALKYYYGKNWKIIPTYDLVHDQRMIDSRININSLKIKINTLR